MHKIVLFAALLPALTAFAQERPAGETSAFKVEFKISDGDPRAGRRFTMLLDGSGRGQLRLGHKVPYTTGNTAAGGMQWNYLEAGLNLDVRLRDLGTRVSLHSEVEISSVLGMEKGAAPTNPTPTVAHTRLNVDAMVSPGKPTIIGAIDDPASQRKLEIEATVTKLN